MKVLAITQSAMLQQTGNQKTRTFKGLSELREVENGGSWSYGAYEPDSEWVPHETNKYNYYPFLDETKEEIELNSKTHSDYSKGCYRYYEYTVKKPLPFTKKDYEQFKNFTLSKKFAVTLEELMKFIGADPTKAEGTIGTVLMDGRAYIRNHLNLRNIKW